ncbi:MAG: XdhC family protein [Bacteroidota bacterium]
MSNPIPLINKSLEEGKIFAVATVINTWGSSPRPVGSQMWISTEGEMVGSVSGGCVEGAVVREALGMIEGQHKGKLLHYGISNDEAWEVGLSCGGKLDVWLEVMQEEEKDLWLGFGYNFAQDIPFVWVNKLDEDTGGHSIWKNGQKVLGQELPNEVMEKAKDAFHNREVIQLSVDDANWLIQPYSKTSTLIVVGAAHLSAELVHLANQLGFETCVIDPRSFFVEGTTFLSQPDQFHTSYPSEVLKNMDLNPFTFAAVLSHDPKIDDNALEVMLRSDIAYIGALGGKKSRAKRQERLLGKGFSQEEIDRIHQPIGLNIGAKGAKEIALSIISQIVQIKNGVK